MKLRRIKAVFEKQIVISLSTMFVSITPMLVINNIIRTDRSTNTLRMMILSTVKPMEYFIGINAYNYDYFNARSYTLRCH